MAGVGLTALLQSEWQAISNSIKNQMVSRGYRSANELRNASQLVLRGQGGGRTYIVPGTGRMSYNKRNHTAKITYRRYVASAPGQPPAVRTGAFRASWQPKSHVEGNSPSGFSVVSQIESTQRTDNGKYLLGELLEDGTSKMAPRPHHERIQNKAMPKIMRIYNEPYV